METTHLFIKNMVCNRCIKVVREELENMGFEVQEIKLGEVVVSGSKDNLNFIALKKNLEQNGFELIDDKKARAVEQVKNVVVELVHQGNNDQVNANFSDIIAERVGLDYNYISSLFSSLEGMTIERYIILQRIEKVKELMVYNELTLSEIAWKTGYSSVQHLSNQFKKITGLTPSHFKKIKENKRRALDQVD
jgi:AraC-like DNA-binding protein